MAQHGAGHAHTLLSSPDVSGSMTAVKKGAHRASAAVMPGLCGLNHACNLHMTPPTYETKRVTACIMLWLQHYIPLTSPTMGTILKAGPLLECHSIAAG